MQTSIIEYQLTFPKITVRERLQALIQIFTTPGPLSAYPYIYVRCGIHVFYIVILSLMRCTSPCSACYDGINLQLNSTSEIEMFGYRTYNPTPSLTDFSGRKDSLFPHYFKHFTFVD